MKKIPLAHNSKVPLAGQDWHNRMSGDPGVHQRWIEQGLNVGTLLEENGIVVVDFDDKEAGREFFRGHREICTVIVETRRGVHLYFSGKTQTRKFSHGDIKGNGYVVAPPSIVDGFPYRWISQGELQPFPENLFPQPIRQISRGVVRNVARYLEKVESKQGQNGSAGLVRAVAVCRDGGLSPAEAMAELIRWNQNPQLVCPPWEPEDLARAVDRTYARKQ